MTERKENRAILVIADMLDGEINRMCITHEMSELEIMAAHAKENIEKLYRIRYEEFRDAKK